MPHDIDILLATYNGEKYLREQIDSIIAQNYRDWRLIIRDDGSSDSTPAILNEYCARHPGKIKLLDNNGQRLGVRENFARLLEAATAEYVMFSDQDDIWLPTKIAVTREKMLEMEACHGSEIPTLVFTNQLVVDENGSTVISESVWRYQGLDPRVASRLNRLMLHNIVTGSTMMLNRPLRVLALPVPAAAYMHDWWITLVAASFGAVGYLPDPTMHYRQHGSNVIGAGKWSLINEMRRFLNSNERSIIAEEREQRLAQYRAQARAFAERFGAGLAPETRAMVETFANLDRYSMLLQKYYILKYRFFYSSPLVTAAMIMYRW